MNSDLLARPHHDGSGLYVSDLSPALGDTVTVRVRVPRSMGVRALYVRQLHDAEPVFVEAGELRHTAHEVWWSAEVRCHNPVTNYRFLLRSDEQDYVWLNGTGLHARDVPDHDDFRLVAYPAPPKWAADAVVYQVFPDRFARRAGAPPIAEIAPDWATPASWQDPVDASGPGIAGSQLYGGDLDGVREHLDHLERLGVTVLYLTPVFPGRSNHRYDASTFDAVDPMLGGDAALHRLVDEAHRRGLRVIGDLTTNHTGADHQWFRRAQEEPSSPERNYYFFGDDGSYDSWLGVPSLPKLNHESRSLRRALVDDPQSSVRRWIEGPHALDGWRIDVANMTGRNGGQDVNGSVAEHLRSTMHRISPELLLIGEHCHDHSLDAQGSGWHGVMNYSGFTRPVWTWLRDKDFAPNFLGAPLMVPRLAGDDVVATVDDFSALVPWRTRTTSFSLLGSHDTTRVRTLVGDDPRLVMVGAALLLTMPGIPMITYGDEIGMRGTTGEDGRRPMNWDECSWESEIFEAYRQLIAARRELEALRDGGLRWVATGDDQMCFVRENASGGVLVHCSRAAHEPVRVPLHRLPGLECGRLIAGTGVQVDFVADDVVLTSDSPGFAVWAWTVEEWA